MDNSPQARIMRLITSVKFVGFAILVVASSVALFCRVMDAGTWTLFTGGLYGGLVAGNVVQKRIQPNEVKSDMPVLPA